MQIGPRWGRRHEGLRRHRHSQRCRNACFWTRTYEQEHFFHSRTPAPVQLRVRPGSPPGAEEGAHRVQVLPVPVPEVQGQGNWELQHAKENEIKVSEYLTTDRPGHLRGSYAVSGLPVGFFAISNLKTSIVLNFIAVVLGMKSLVKKNAKKGRFCCLFRFQLRPLLPRGRRRRIKNCSKSLSKMRSPPTAGGGREGGGGKGGGQNEVSWIRKMDTYIFVLLFILCKQLYIFRMFLLCLCTQDGKGHSEREGGEVYIESKCGKPKLKPCFRKHLLRAIINWCPCLFKRNILAELQKHLWPTHSTVLVCITVRCFSIITKKVTTSLSRKTRKRKWRCWEFSPPPPPPPHRGRKTCKKR